MSKHFSIHALEKFNLILLILIISVEINCLSIKSYNEGKDPTKWFDEAQNSLNKKLHATKQNKLKAVNVILFLGDGMSIPTLTAARIHLEQRANITGEYNELEMDTFEYSGLSKTYCADSQVADSACSATAYLAGVKANIRTIGVTDRVPIYDCKAATNRKNHVSSIAEWAQKSGKLTGIVTPTRVTHASPAGNYAHVSYRGTESDYDIWKSSDDLKNIKYCRDIAKQLVFDAPGKFLNVIMGGGRSKFLSKENITYFKSEFGTGERMDGQDLIDAWYKNKEGQNPCYIKTRDELLNLDVAKVDNLLGLFADSHMKFNLDNSNEEVKEPTLAEMTETAIKLLKKGDKGFFLFVEGGNIDIAHHKTLSRKALDETIEFSKAIRVAKSLTSNKDTLIVVTSDHAHTMSISGYSKIEQDILGLNTKNSNVDGLPYATLSYANGPIQKRDKDGSRLNLIKDDFNDKNYQYPSNVPMTAETHGGDDVAVFATGPWSHLFTGVYEQNVIPHLMAYASCIGNGETLCNNK